MTHLERCCPDLLAAMAPPPPVSDSTADDNDTLRTWLEGLHEHEEALRQAALAVAFRQYDAEGNRLRQGPPEVAAALGLPPRRATRLLQAAMRAVPLAADIEHPVEVLWEDNDLIAVAKPAGVISAPKHRYTGGRWVVA